MVVEYRLIRYRTTPNRRGEQGVAQRWCAVRMGHKVRGYGTSKSEARRDMCSDETRLRRDGHVNPPNFEKLYMPAPPKKKTAKERR